MNPYRRALIAGNWKMNAGGRDACPLALAVAEGTRACDRVDVVVAPPTTAIAAVAHEIETSRGSIDVTRGFGIGVAAQTMSEHPTGAYTGEVSASMLEDAGASWVILGHSERRQIFGESDEQVADKVRAAMSAKLKPIVCVGETLAEREAGETLAVVERQTRAFMRMLGEAPGFGVIAYEPIWAIGTGKVASPADAQEVHAHLRELLVEVSEELAESTRILYGGSVKEENADGLFSEEDIDGALVGGASLDGEGFSGIVNVAQRISVQLAGETTGGFDEDEAADAAEPVSISAPAPTLGATTSDEVPPSRRGTWSDEVPAAEDFDADDDAEDGVEPEAGDDADADDAADDDDAENGAEPEADEDDDDDEDEDEDDDEEVVN